MKKIIFPMLTLALVGCAGTTDVVSSNSETTTSSSMAASDGDYTIHDAFGWFHDTALNVNVTYSFFDTEKAPSVTTTYSDVACFSTYKNFTNLTTNQGLIDVDAELAAKKGIAAGVYAWTKEKDAATEKSVLVLGDKVGTGSYKDMYHVPEEICADALTYETEFVPEFATQRSGYFFLNRDGANDALVEKLAVSLGIYNVVHEAGLIFKSIKMYIGASSKVINFTFYLADGTDGYDAYQVSVSCAAFGTVKIAEVTNYIGE